MRALTFRGQTLGPFVRLLVLLLLLPVLSVAQAFLAPVTLLPGATPVGQSAAAATLSLSIVATGTAASPVAVTQGISSTEFALGAGSPLACTGGQLYLAGQQCTVTVVFTPTLPGLRSGAVVLRGTDGTLLGVALVSGVATGPLAVFTQGMIETVAGTTEFIYRGDGASATVSPIFLPTGIVTDGAGNLFLADSGNNRIRRVDAASGLMSTVAGNGTAGYTGDGIPATQASISSPSQLAIDGAGNLYFADTGNQVVRRVDAVTCLIATVAGTPGKSGYTTGVPATDALLASPQGIALDAAGNLFIADTGNDAVRRVDAGTGLLTTVAGTASPGFNGDGLATAHQLNSPWNLASALDGSLYIADQNNQRIRRLNGTNLTTVVGFSQRGFAGDNGPATDASLNFPEGIAVDPAGDLYIADTGDNVIRFVDAATGIITSLAGTTSQGFLGDGGPANLAGIYGPDALHVDAVGNLYLADLFHNRIRRVDAAAINFMLTTQKVGKPSSPPRLVPFLNAGNAPLTAAPPLLSQATLDPGTTTCQVGIALAPSGLCTLGAVFLPTTVGSGITGTITVASDAANPAPVITLQADVLAVNPTSVSLTSSLNPSLVGQAVTFTATVTSDDTGRMGTVDFSENGVKLCTSTLTPKGTATCTPPAMSLGSHPIIATYSGDPNNAAATSTPLVQVVKQPPVPALTVTPNPAIVTQAVTLSVTVTAPTGTPTGTVVFNDGTTALGSVVLSNGTATFTTTALTAGSHPLTVHYIGDATNAPADSNTVAEVIQLATTTTTLSASMPTASAGAPITFTATVVSANASAPTGTVTFFDGTTPLITATATAGTAIFTCTSLSPGAHSITATYSGDADNATSTSAAQLVTISQIATATALTADANPVSAGAVLHLTATVTGATVNGGALTGSVTFSDGAMKLGTAALDAGGHATFAISTLTVGGHALLATFTGSTNYSSSSSSPLSETVQQTATTLTLTSLVNPTVFGQTATFTATITSTTGVPSGQVMFSDNGALLGTATLNAGGLATLATGKLTVGTHSIVATYISDGFYSAGTSAPVPQVVNPAANTTALVSSANPATLGAAVTLTATVTSATSLTGTVTFSDGSSPLGTVNVVNGTATLTLSTLSFGTHTVIATYSGDTSHAASTSAPLAQQVVQPATLTLASSLNPAAAGNAVTFTAKVLPVAGTQPSGSLLFRDGTAALATVALDATGTATFTTSTLAVGPHTINVAYAGDPDFSSGTATLLETIQSSSVQIALTVSANPAVYTTPLTVTAVITTNGAIATGLVTFTDGTTALGTGTLDAAGTAAFTTKALTPGVHSLSAVYAGDGKAGAGSSIALTVTVEQATTLTLASSANPAQTLAPLTLTATLSTSGTGTITFADGTVQLGTAPLVNGVATLTVPQLTAGTHTLTAAYAGDPINFPSTSPPLTETVNLRPTATTLSGTATDPNNPQQVLLIGVVHANGPTPATGTITFMSGTVTLGSAAIDPTGVGTLSVTLTSGVGTLTATYSGDVSYAGSTSTATTITVGQPTQFSLALSPSSLTLASLQHATSTLTVASVSGFSDTLEFGCLGLPFAATCTFSAPQKALAANGTTSVLVTIDTGDPLGAGGSAALAPLTRNITLAFLPLGALLLCVRRRRPLPLLLVVLAAALTLTSTGCGGLTIHGTPAGTYNFKITAAGKGSGATQSQTMTLTVTQ